MRKFSKILSAVLVICLLCGAVVMSVFANTTEGNSAILKMTDHTKTYAEDYETLASGQGEGYYTTNMSSFAGAGVSEDAYGNKYLRVHRKDGATQYTGTSGMYYGFEGKYDPWNGTKDNAYFISNVADTTDIPGQTGLKGTQLSAIVVDFDFGSDMYSYDLNGTRQMGKTVPEGATNVTVALDGVDQSPFCMMVRIPVVDATTGAGSAGGSAYGWAGFKCEDGEWYITEGQKGTGKAIKLSNEPGVLDHITAIIYPSSSVGSAVIEYYVNGEFLNRTSVGAVAKSNYVFFDEFRMSFTKTDDLNLGCYSYAYDNVAVNFYPAGYESTEGFGIDDFIKGTDTTKNLYDCVDVVYNSDYVQAGQGSISVNNGPKYTLPAFFEKALAGVKTGDVINVDGANVSGFTPAEDVEGFTVNITNGGSFALSAEASSKYVGTESAGSLVYSLATDEDKVTIQWIDSDGETVLDEGELALGSAPDASSAPAVTETFNYATGKIGAHSKWVWDPDGAGEDYSERDICALDEDILLASWLNEETPGVIQIKPVMEERNAAFGLVNASGVAYAPAGYKFADFAKLTNLKNVILAAESGSTVKFYDDDADGKLLLDMANVATISTANFKLSIDLNGLTVLQYAAEGYGSCWFSVRNDGIEINIYNGSIIQSLKHSSTAEQYDMYGASGVVNVAPTVDTCTVNYGTADGKQPLNYYGGSVFYAQGTKDETMYGNGRIYCNVYGGTYMMTTRVAYSLFAVLCPDVTITIKDAQIIANETTSVYGVFADYSGQVTTGQKIYCYNTDIIRRQESNGAALQMFADKLGGLEIHFEGCTIYSGHKSGSGSVIFGPGNTLVAGSLANNIAETGVYRFDENTAKANSNGATKTVTITYPVNFQRKIDATKYSVDDLKNPNCEIYDLKTVNFEFEVAYITYDTTDTENLPEGVAKVDFSLDGQTNYKTEYWVVGSTIGSEGPAYDASSMESIALNNGWFDIAYGGWASASGSEVIAESGNSFIPAKIAVPNIKAKLNMSLYGHFGINLHIPPACEGVTWNGFYETSGTKITTNNSSRFIDGVKYQYNTWYPNVSGFHQMTRVVKFTIAEYDLNGNGTIEDNEKNIELEQSFSYGVLDYVDRVIAVPEYGCGTDEATLMHDLVQYMEQGTLLCSPATITSTIRTRIDGIYTKLSHGEACTCGTDLDSIVFSAEENAITQNSYADLAKIGYGITYVMDEQPNLSMYMKPLAEGQTATVAVTAKGINGEDISYGRIANTAGVADTYEGNACVRYDSVSMPGYAIKSVITIKVTITTEGVAEPAVYTGQFCLAEYIEQNPTVTAAKAFWAYSNSAYEYKVVRVGEE